MPEGGAPDPSAPTNLNSSKENEHQKDHEDQPQAATGVVAPTTAVGPGRQCANQKDDKDD